MRNFIIRIVINAVAIDLTASLLPGIHVLNNDLSTLLILGLIFGVVNALVKPIITFLTCPFILLTLGLFIFVINGMTLMLTASLSSGRLNVDNLGWAILGGIIMGIIGVILETVLGLREKDMQKQNSGI
jgi:putative membrane protein